MVPWQTFKELMCQFWLEFNLNFDILSEMKHWEDTCYKKCHMVGESWMYGLLMGGKGMLSVSSYFLRSLENNCNTGRLKSWLTSWTLIVIYLFISTCLQPKGIFCKYLIDVIHFHSSSGQGLGSYVSMYFVCPVLFCIVILHVWEGFK